MKLTGDLTQLQEIHRRLFQDVYDWAGMIRTVDIRKDGGLHFMPFSRLQSAAGFTFEELREQDMLRGLSTERFIEQLAIQYDNVNAPIP